MNEVMAVKDRDDIDRIGHLLNKHYSQLMADVWSFGINAALRISDLLSIEYKDIKTAGGITTVVIREGKTGKQRIVELNRKAIEIYTRRTSCNPSHGLLFQNVHHHSNGRAISRESVSRAFKDIGNIVDIQLGTHSMRKTRGYHLYKQNNDLALVQKLLNHRNSAETLRYIGLNDADVSASYHDLEL